MDEITIKTHKEIMDSLINKIAEYFPNLIDKDTVKVEKVDEYKYVIPTNVQVVIEYFITRFSKVFGLKCLYGVADVNERRQKCVLYAIPEGKMMYNVYLLSDQYGAVSRISIQLFDSLEQQFIDLAQKLRELKRFQGIIYEQQNMLTLTKLFV